MRTALGNILRKGLEVDETGLGWRQMVGLGTSGVEPSGSDTRNSFAWSIPQFVRQMHPVLSQVLKQRFYLHYSSTLELEDIHATLELRSDVKIILTSPHPPQLCHLSSDVTTAEDTGCTI
jgi:hypothetical protein